MSLTRRRPMARALAIATLLVAPLPIALAALAQAPGSRQALATEHDYRSMLKQLGITAMRPPASSDPQAPNHANYDESRANPYPRWPDPLIMQDGRRVTSARMWYRQRRPQIVRAFENDVYGRVPADAPRITWKVDVSEAERVGRVPVIATRVIGHADDSTDPAIRVTIPMILVKPVHHAGPMPVLIRFVLGPPQFPAPVPPSPESIERINAALKASLARQDPALAQVFRTHPAWEPIARPPFFAPPRPANDPVQQLVADGWAVALINPTSIQPDNGAGLTRGVIGLANRGQPRKPDDWGVLRAWAWGASQVRDYLSKDPDLDARHIGIEGVSRYGKAALVAMAFDQRFSMGLIGSSGRGGAAPFRRDFGERLTNLTGMGEYHWMAGNFLRYGASKARGGAETAADLPVESSELIALCAPRLVFISYGSPAAGDALWVDQQGSYMAAVAADPVYRLLGAQGLGVGDDYRHARKPPIGIGLLGGELAWRQDSGGHTDVPNFKYFIWWADHWMKRSPPDAR
ncbi:MAG: alpha/beta hydrolase family protein [Steroidobacteraceae bacterium]